MNKDNSKINDTILQSIYNKNVSSYNRLDTQTPLQGTQDRLNDVRIRLAVIDNPDIRRAPSDRVDELGIKNIINTNNGKLTLKWIDSPGGVIRPQETSGEWVYQKNKDKYNPEDRDFDEWSITSKREQVSIGYPFIWANDTNWCGFNYMPPVGSVVMVGFRKQGFPLILGYVNTHYKICYPIVKPGETVMKGYGNNYIHWRWSDKIDMKAWCKEGEGDIDDPSTRDGSKVKKNAATCTLWLRLNANDRYIEISADETTSGSIKDGSFNKYPTPHNEKDARSSKIVIKPSSILMQTGYTTYYQQNEAVTITTKEFTVNAENIHMNADNNINSKAGNNLTDTVGNNVSMTAGNVISTHSGANTNITAGAIINVKGSRINLN